MATNKDDIIYDLIKEIKLEQKEQREILNDIKLSVVQNTDDVAVHMKRSDHLELMWKHIEERVEKLEEPKKAWDFLYSKAAKIIAAATGVAGVVVYLIEQLSK